MGPVWGLEWVAKERSELYSSTGHEEMLVSVSGDGHVVQWTIRKEFKGNSESRSVHFINLQLFHAVV